MSESKAVFSGLLRNRNDDSHVVAGDSLGVATPS
jgi:hypothetical protein